MSQRDLFAEQLIDGLAYSDHLINEAEQAALLARLETCDLSPFRFHGWEGKRRTKTYGWRYDFDDATFTPAEPIPDWLLPLREKASVFAGKAADEFVHVLLARYDPGAGIGWHRDRPLFEDVVGVSLGAAVTMRFRQRTDAGFHRANVRLEPGSAYLLSRASRWDWEHSISPGKNLRFSITFRTLSLKGQRAVLQH